MTITSVFCRLAYRQSPVLSTHLNFRAMSTVSTHPSLSVVHTPNAPLSLGPYCQAIKFNGIVYVSGNVPVDPVTNQVVPGGVKEQAEQVFKNLRAVVEASGSEFGKVIKTNCFLKDMNDFDVFNNAFASAFGSHKPVRTTVEVARLPKDVLVEVECIASL